MGSFYGKSATVEQNTISIEDFEIIGEIDLKVDNTSDLDKLIKFIKKIKPKNINFPEDFFEKSKLVELNNYELLSMGIELYQKLFDLLGEYQLEQSENDHRNKIAAFKRAFFVKPNFGVDDIIKSLISTKNNQTIDENLLVINEPVIQMLCDEISIDEYNKSFNDTLTKKDMMGISKRILKEMAMYLKIRFVNTYNDILNDPIKISKSSIAKGSYIYKVVKKGPVDDITSFRQIIAIPNVVNQFHRILNIRLCNYMLQNNYINTTIQKGSIAGQKYGIFEQFFKIKNVIDNANNQNLSCCLLFLDITNAFGNVHLKNLYKILELYNVDQKFINYLTAFYDNLVFYVDSTNINTNAIKWSDGLVQGCSMSPLLFIIAMNYILSHLDTEYKDEHGYDLGDNKKILLTAYVDDICIICKNPESAQIVFTEFERLCAVLGLPISRSKSATMIINSESDNLHFGDDLEIIPTVTQFKYLGEYLSSNGDTTKFTKQFIKTLVQKMLYIDRKISNDVERIDYYNKIVVP